MHFLRQILQTFCTLTLLNKLKSMKLLKFWAGTESARRMKSLFSTLQIDGLNTIRKIVGNSQKGLYYNIWICFRNHKILEYVYDYDNLFFDHINEWYWLYYLVYTSFIPVTRWLSGLESTMEYFQVWSYRKFTFS